MSAETNFDAHVFKARKALTHKLAVEIEKYRKVMSSEITLLEDSVLETTLLALITIRDRNS